MHTPEYWAAQADRHHAALDHLVQEYDRADEKQDNARCHVIAEKINATEAAIWRAEEMFDLAMTSPAERPLP